MPTLRKVHRSGTSAVVALPEIARDMCGLDKGTTARIDCYTPTVILREFGVAQAIIDQLVLQEEHFIVVRRHVE